MKIEILFPEICYLYGDKANSKYLKQCLKDATFIETTINEEPRFLTEKIDLVYMCSMPESGQEKIINKLLKYKDKIKELVDSGVIFLLVGNSFEIFTDYIEKENNEKIECLGILDNMYSKRILPKRENSLFLGKFNDIDIVGYTSRFSHSYGEDKYGIFDVEKGLGLNPESKYGAIRKNNLFGTYLLGPLLISNPLFTKYIIELSGIKTELEFEKDIMKAYNVRLEEFKKDIKFDD